MLSSGDVFLNVIQDRRSFRLELAIIALIAFEVIVGPIADIAGRLF